MDPNFLTDSELDFLRTNGLSPADVYDARGQARSVWRSGAKAAGNPIILGSACKEASHRLRTRSGHCVQCDTSKFAYSGVFSATGYLYLAATKTGYLYKFGCTKDVQDRQKQLRTSRYGGFSDWTVLAYAMVVKMGHAEKKITSSLAEKRVTGQYSRDGRDQTAVEMFNVTLEEALMVFANAAQSHQGREFWKHPELATFKR